MGLLVLFSTFAVLLGYLLAGVHAGKALLSLDQYTFPHVVDGSRPVLVKFDRKYAVDAVYSKLAAEVANSNSDLLVAEVEVDEQSEVEIAQEKGFPHEGLSDELWNIDLHNKYTAGHDLTLGAVYCLFSKGGSHNTMPLTYKGGAAKDLNAWLRSSGMRIGPKGTVYEMEEPIETLRGGGTIDAALWQANAALSRLTETDVTKAAEYYVQVLVLAKKHGGDEYIAQERGRLMRLIESSNVALEKRESLQPRLNVLNQFAAAFFDAKIAMAN